MSKRTVNLITIIILLAAVFFAYRFFFVTPEPEAEPGVVTTESTIPGAEVNGGEFLALLLSVQDIKLSKNVFNNPVFRDRLKDFGRELPSRFVGRTNPFAPFGVGEVGTSTTGARPPVGTSTPATATSTSSSSAGRQATTTTTGSQTTVNPTPVPTPAPAPAPAPAPTPTSNNQGGGGTDFNF